MEPYIATGDKVVINAMLEEYKKQLRQYVSYDSKKTIKNIHMDFLAWCSNLLEN